MAGTIPGVLVKAWMCIRCTQPFSMNPLVDPYALCSNRTGMEHGCTPTIAVRVRSQGIQTVAVDISHAISHGHRRDRLKATRLGLIHPLESKGEKIEAVCGSRYVFKLFHLRVWIYLCEKRALLVRIIDQGGQPDGGDLVLYKIRPPDHSCYYSFLEWTSVRDEKDY
ncbi:hypothetical protein C7212DRAFT_347064 [Tuber magnatum]|uniref:Uncharacterized protein n=1 Tax=Tuber magnatum TaxID=42249 RepID=A0A317SGL4_9PEZI|nr:hypothetical protein C7212DRAFT_347064 [Tuber magnatum]